MRKTSIQLAVLITGAVMGAAICSFAQGPGAMPHPAPPSTTRDPNDNLKTDDTSSASESMVRGQAALANGSVPEGLAAIYLDCGGAQKFIAVADSKGRFSFNPGALSGIGETKGCIVRASVEGYRSETKSMAEVKPNGSTKLGKILLQPLSSDANGLTSLTSAQASKGAKKAYEKGLDAAAKQDWAEAKTSLLKATAAYADYSAAWLSLGILEQSEGDRGGAQKSFAEAVRSDGKFAVPLILMAAQDALGGDWQATVEHSQKAIALNPSAFPHAYELNALGNLNLGNSEAVEKSATEGLKVDTGHEHPELEYLLGVVLATRHDLDGATKHLRTYIDQSPNGPNIVRAKKVMEELRASH